MADTVDSRVEDALRRQSQLEAARTNFDSHCQEVADLVLPRQRLFNRVKRVGGEKLSERVFDSTAMLALERFAAAIEDLLTPRTSRWHELEARGPFKGRSDGSDTVPEEVKSYLYEVTSRLFRARYAPTANFASQASQSYISLGAFGNGAIFVDDLRGQGIRYKEVAFAELFWAENFQGVVDTIHRRFEMSARNLVARFGDTVPEAVRKAAEQEPDRKFEVVHCVKPREDADWRRKDYKGMAFASYYILMDGRRLLSEGGFRTQRYAISRYNMASNEVYGRSPAMTVLADIKSVNQQRKTLLRTSELAADPPILLSNDDAMSPFKLRPGALNYGTVSDDGRPLAVPFQTGANLPVNLESLREDRSLINDAFLVTLFRVLVEGPQITATEALLRAQDKGALLAPTMGRQQSEMLGPLIQAELDILSQAGQLPPPPEALLRGDFVTDITYTSPLARAQRAEEGVAILHTVQDATALVQLDPKAARIIDAEKTIRKLAEIRGMPPDLLRSAEDVEADDQEQASTDQLKNVLGAADVASGAAKNLAQAQALQAASPSQPAPAGVAA